ncbi:altronate dehydratase [Halomonas sp. MCCC 1A17488]|uniref:Altronate dehydratase n=1 Tax=Billgrantia sulfidoxydans TaxID=2733484 RepID=A0ABX7W484_9GAMM|nr:MULTISPECIES: altronate dehydratase family protein [Halomonas]MCE8015013.1 altronate dehydratase [Halomonas sp. MCCC 1A17488]MCG3238346.1 altronate dehydratase [Halomonas sp. MCCC 1A17488]QPP47905.1 altronate dehydratase [Halomonas sp. SS10-MC5]QTP55208.1 altronate dehydratase [Halomonas sulfidoxydans]
MSDTIASSNGSLDSLRVHAADNVRVALKDLAPGTLVDDEGRQLRLAEPVRHKHKFSLTDLDAGDAVIMYGVTVGRATRPIPAGTAISVDNTEHSTATSVPQARRGEWHAPDVSAFAGITFEGYHRPDGKVGTANVWLVVPLVFCENRNIEVLRQCVADALGEDPYRDYKRMARALLHGERAGEQAAPARERPFPNVDGVRFLTHTLGCGGTDDDAQALCQLLAGYICHPNVAGATVLSLGCQKAQIEMLRAAVAERDPRGLRPVHYLEQQASASEEALIRDALTTIFDGLAMANGVTRAPAPLSALTLGVECGGSDGFSGLSANPLVGAVVDRLVALGGSGILSEFPELCGVEHELMARCRDDGVAERFQALMEAYQRHAARVGADFSMNPSPGNIRDGLITDAMKSAGAAKKGGDSPVVDVLDYTEPQTRAGLNLLCTPGNDVESTTALAGSGANLILFTTGLGTPTGNPVAPVLKIASNSELAARMADVIDFDAGSIIRGEASIGELADALLRLCIDTASGRYMPKAVGLAQYDFIPWKRGVSL